MFSFPHLICTTNTVYSTYLDLYEYTSIHDKPLTERIPPCRLLTP